MMATAACFVMPCYGEPVIAECENKHPRKLFIAKEKAFEFEHPQKHAQVMSLTNNLQLWPSCLTQPLLLNGNLFKSNIFTRALLLARPAPQERKAANQTEWISVMLPGLGQLVAWDTSEIRNQMA